MQCADFIFSYFSGRFWSFEYNILSFSVCYYCYHHCILQHAPLLEVFFDILLVAELLIYSEKKENSHLAE